MKPLGIRGIGILVLLLGSCSDGKKATGLESLVSLEVAASLAFAEGPAYHPDGRLFFTDLANNRTVVLDAATPQGTVGRIPGVFRKPSGRANGLAICPDDETYRQAGDPVDIIMLDWNEEVDL